jgi:Zn-finger nucleic acid-binding protein
MNCPVDRTPLTMTERQGVEIDYCPSCRGVWLDRGELDKLIERSASWSPRRERGYRDHDDDDYDDDDDRERSRSYGHEPYGQRPYDKQRKRKGLLGDLFDF